VRTALKGLVPAQGGASPQGVVADRTVTISRHSLAFVWAAWLGSACAPVSAPVEARAPVSRPVALANDGDPGASPVPASAARDVAAPPSPAEAGPGWLGVSLVGRGPGEPGVVVGNVLRRSPAALAGLQVGDVVVGINDQRVASPEQFSRLIAESGAGGARQPDAGPTE
jgi:membrane-associated protease RseP (regulator of RpoE activity)